MAERDSGPFDRLSLTDFPGFVDGDLELRGRLFVICGGNAVGKTRLLRGLYEGDANGSGQVVLHDSGNAISTTTTTTTTSSYIDPGLLVARQMISISTDSALEERIGAAEFGGLKADVADQLSYVLGCRYERFEVAELEAEDAYQPLEELDPWAVSVALGYAPDVVPYYRVERAGRTYDSRQMSQGELVAATLVWALARADREERLFIEEPDSALSPVSSARCLDLLASMVHGKYLSAFVTSHSATGLGRVPIGRLLLLKRDSTGRTGVGPATRVDLRRELEVPLEKHVLFVVEDRAGHQWLQEVLAAQLPEHAPAYEILIANGESQVRKACGFPQGMEGFGSVIWGVFDGDQRADVGTRKLTSRSFLPGLHAPERVIVDFLLAETAPEIAGLDVEHARQELRRFEGLDLHDQIESVARELGIAVPRLRSLVWTAFGTTSEGADHINELVDEIRQLPWTHTQDAALDAPPVALNDSAAVASAQPHPVPSLGIARRMLRAIKGARLTGDA